NLLSTDFSLSGVGFLGLGKEYNKWLYKVRYRVFTRMLKKLNLPLETLSVLDMGCGTGFYVNIWAEKGVKQLTGLDLTESSPRNLSQTFPDYRFFTSDIANPEQPVDGETFDVVTAFDVLFHIVDDEKFENAVSNMGRLVKPGGLVLISANFPRKEQPGVYCQKNRTLEHYQRILQPHGVETQIITPVFYLMNAPIDLEGRNKAVQFFFKVIWKVIRKLVKSGETMGNITGFLIYYLEILLSLFFKGSPTTKLMVARKK
ncbi:MAG: class I SAM-dependent methyltransferase, partial [bacterium]|nr:class I SAM-dependent methyltransferase [bacterium]